jgi:two-component system chemotaxis response regulator CheB
LGEQSPFTCPDCGGTLWHIQDGKISRYRCFTGHAYSEEHLLHEQDKNMETTFWIALRMMEERKKLLEKFPGMRRKSDTDIESHIKQLKQLLANILKVKEEHVFNKERAQP